MAGPVPKGHRVFLGYPVILDKPGYLDFNGIAGAVFSISSANPFRQAAPAEPTASRAVRADRAFPAIPVRRAGELEKCASTCHLTLKAHSPSSQTSTCQVPLGPVVV